MYSNKYIVDNGYDYMKFSKKHKLDPIITNIIDIINGNCEKIKI